MKVADLFAVLAGPQAKRHSAEFDLADSVGLFVHHDRVQDIHVEVPDPTVVLCKNCDRETLRVGGHSAYLRGVVVSVDVMQS